MTNTNCQNCDKPECDESAMHEAWMSDHDSDEKLHAWCAAHATCFANTVNWRARALTETARADAAEAELRALREALPKWQNHKLRENDMVLWSFGAEIGRVWLWAGKAWSRFGDVVTQHVDMGAARRLVEQHHGLPPCEVLP